MLHWLQFSERALPHMLHWLQFSEHAPRASFGAPGPAPEAPSRVPPAALLRIIIVIISNDLCKTDEARMSQKCINQKKLLAF